MSKCARLEKFHELERLLNPKQDAIMDMAKVIGVGIDTRPVQICVTLINRHVQTENAIRAMFPPGTELEFEVGQIATAC
jgi:hypothetical protein